MSAPGFGMAGLAGAVAALVEDPDVADVLHHLLIDCADVLGADAVAILAKGVDGELSLLSATSHRVAELEVLQIQREAGPCVDVLASNRHLCVTGAQGIEERWGQVGRRIVAAGYTSVEAYPMRWRGTVLGGLNVFRRNTPPEAATRPGVGQAFADVATLTIITSRTTSVDEATGLMARALGARDVVEQAKGVLAHVEDLDMGTAYDSLLQRAKEAGQSLTKVAQDIVTAQHRRR